MGGRGPRRLSDVAHVAAKYESFLKEGQGKHPWHFDKLGKRTYPVPAHNGRRTEITWKYIRGLCRAHDIPESAFTDN